MNHLNVNEMMIGPRAVSVNEPVFLIAEIGVNHDGDVGKAFELVRTACRCGAGAVKLQIFNADELVHDSMPDIAYQQRACPGVSNRQLLQRCQLSFNDLDRVVNAIREEGMIPLATPFSINDLQACVDLKLPAIKIASPDLVNQPLLREAVKLGRPLIVSTGAATLSEIEMATAWLRHWGAEFALLQCTSSYPAQMFDAQLRCISELAQHLNVITGFSDHTTSTATGGYAVMAGARIIEKHLTLDCNAPGPDHAASADPEQFAEYSHMIRQAERIYGRPGKRVLNSEREVRTSARQSLVLTQPVKAGEPMTPDIITVKRPGTGIPAAEMSSVVGLIATNDLKAGTMLEWGMLRRNDAARVA